MNSLIWKPPTVLLSMGASNLCFARKYRILSESLALTQMTEASATAMEQIALYQNLMTWTPVVLLFAGIAWVGKDIKTFMEDMKDE